MTAPTRARGRLDEIEQRLNAATPGPWRYNPSCDRIDLPNHDWAGTMLLGMEDIAFVAAAPDDVRWLIERVRELEAAQAVQAIASAKYKRAGESDGRVGGGGA